MIEPHNGGGDAHERSVGYLRGDMQPPRTHTHRHARTRARTHTYDENIVLHRNPIIGRHTQIQLIQPRFGVKYLFEVCFFPRFPHKTDACVTEPPTPHLTSKVCRYCFTASHARSYTDSTSGFVRAPACTCILCILFLWAGGAGPSGMQVRRCRRCYRGGCLTPSDHGFIGV